MQEMHMTNRLKTAFILAVAAVIVLMVGCGVPGQRDVGVAGSRPTIVEEAQRDDAEETSATDFLLPDISLVSAEDTPMLYDFVNGSIGWKWDYNILPLDMFFALVWKPDEPTDVFVSYYSIAEIAKYPPLGSTPIQYRLTEQEAKVIKSSIDNMSSDLVHEEGEYQIALIKEYLMPDEANIYDGLDEDYKWGGMNFLRFTDPTVIKAGPMEVRVDSGEGYPTDWLRKPEWAAQLLEVTHIDISWDFWDRYRVKEKREYYGKDQTGGPPMVTIYVENTDSFLLVDQNGEEVHINEEQLGILLEIEEYEMR
jgi:hypothetical protein